MPPHGAQSVLGHVWWGILTIVAIKIFNPDNNFVDRYEPAVIGHDDTSQDIVSNVNIQPLTESAEQSGAVTSIFDVPTSTETQYVTVVKTQPVLPHDYNYIDSRTRRSQSRNPHANNSFINFLEVLVFSIKHSTLLQSVSHYAQVFLYNPVGQFLRAVWMQTNEIFWSNPGGFIGMFSAARDMCAFAIVLAMVYVDNVIQRRRDPYNPPPSPPPPGSGGDGGGGGGGGDGDRGGDPPPGGSPPTDPPTTPGPPGTNRAPTENFTHAAVTGISTSPIAQADDPGRIAADLLKAAEETERLQKLETDLKECNDTSAIKTKTIQDKDAAIEKLEAEQKRVQELRNSSSAETSDLRVKLRSAQAALASKEEELGQERARARKNAERATEAATRAASDRSQLKTLQTRNTASDHDLQHLRDELNRATAERDHLQAVARDQAAAAEEAKDSAVARAWSQRSLEADNLKRRYDALSTELEGSRREVAELRASAPPPSASAPQSDGPDVAALREEIGSLKASLEEEKEKTASAKLEGLSERMEVFGSPGSTAKHEQALKALRETRSEVADLTGEKQRLTQQNETLLKKEKQRNEAAAKQQQDAAASLQRSRDAEKAVKAALEVAQAQVTSLSRSKADSEAALREQQMTADEEQRNAKIELQRLKEAEEKARAQIEELNGRIKSLSEAQREGIDALQQQQQLDAAAEKERLEEIAREAERRAYKLEEEKKQAEDEVRYLRDTAINLATQLDNEKNNNDYMTRSHGNEIQHHVDHNAQLQIAHDHFKAQSEHYATNGRNLEDTHSTLQANYDTLQSNYDALQSRFNTLESEHNTLRTEGQAQLDNIRNDATNMINGLQSKISSLRQERDGARNQLQNANNGLQTERKRLETSKLNLVKRLNEVLEENAKLEETYKISDRELMEVSDDKHTLKIQNDGLNEELKEAQDHVEDLEETIKRLTQESTSLRGRVTELGRTVEQLTREERIIEFERTIEQLKQENAILRQHNDHLISSQSRIDTSPPPTGPVLPSGTDAAGGIMNWSNDMPAGNPQDSPSGPSFNFGSDTPSPSFNFGSGTPSPSPAHTTFVSPSKRGEKRFSHGQNKPASDVPVMINSPTRQVAAPRSRLTSPVRSASPLRSVMNANQRPASPFAALTNIPNLNATTTPTFTFNAGRIPGTPRSLENRDDSRRRDNERSAAERKLQIQHQQDLEHEENKRQAAIAHEQLIQGETNYQLGNFNNISNMPNNGNVEQDTAMDTVGDTQPQHQEDPALEEIRRQDAIFQQQMQQNEPDDEFSDWNNDLNMNANNGNAQTDMEMDTAEHTPTSQRQQGNSFQQGGPPTPSTPQYVQGSAEEIAKLRTLEGNQDGRFDESYRMHGYENPDEWNEEDTDNPMPMYYKY